MRNYSLVPRPWWEVGLTVLPGRLDFTGGAAHIIETGPRMSDG